MAVAGAARLAVAHVAGRTAVVEARAHSPLRLLAPRVHGDAAWAFTSSFGGGLVDGDALALDVDVRDEATLLLLTQASTKVYRSPRGTSQALRARVAPGGTLACLPDPITCFAGARFAQRIDVELAAGASLVLTDAVTSGRSARGERWVFDRYESRIVVEQGERRVLVDAVLLDPAHGELPSRMGRFDALATLVLAGPRFAAARVAIHEDVSARANTARPTSVVASSLVGEDLLLVRIGATSTAELVTQQRALLAPVLAALGADPFARKW